MNIEPPFCPDCGEPMVWDLLQWFCPCKARAMEAKLWRGTGIPYCHTMTSKGRECGNFEDSRKTFKIRNPGDEI